MATRSDVTRLAATCNVQVDTWSPGDGQTRYRMINPEHESASGGYFGASGYAILGTLLGAGEAYTWLQGYRAAMLRVGDRTVLVNAI